MELEIDLQMCALQVDCPSTNLEMSRKTCLVLATKKRRRAGGRREGKRDMAAQIRAAAAAGWKKKSKERERGETTPILVKCN